MSRFGKLLKRGPKPIFAKSHYIYTEDIKATPFMKKTAGFWTFNEARYILRCCIGRTG